MKPAYLAGLCADLIRRSAHPHIASVEPWHGLNGDVHGLRITYTDGSAHGLQTVAGSPPGGGSPSGTDTYTPADQPAGDVTPVQVVTLGARLVEAAYRGARVTVLPLKTR